MISYSIKNRSNRLYISDTSEGEWLETKIERVVNNSEPIKDGAPLIYTARPDGVQPQYDIRTDRFDVAIEAMDKVSKSYTARRDGKAEMKAEKGGESDSEAKSKTSGTDGKSEANGA